MTENELLGLRVKLGWDDYAIPPGYVAPGPGVPARSLPLWQIGGPAHRGSQLYGSALRAILEQIRGALARRGLADAQVRLEKRALRHLGKPRNDGLLMIQVGLHPIPG